MGKFEVVETGGGEPLSIGDLVSWKGADEDVPAGTVGRVYRIFGDGDVEIAFVGKDSKAPPKLFTFHESRLDLVEDPSKGEGLPMPPRTSTKRKSSFNKDRNEPPPRFAAGDLVTWKGSDADVPEGSVGRIARLFGDGDIEVAFERSGSAIPHVFTFHESRLDLAADQDSAPNIVIPKVSAKQRKSVNKDDGALAVPLSPEAATVVEVNRLSFFGHLKR